MIPELQLALQQLSGRFWNQDALHRRLRRLFWGLVDSCGETIPMNSMEVAMTFHNAVQCPESQLEWQDIWSVFQTFQIGQHTTPHIVPWIRVLMNL